MLKSWFFFFLVVILEWNKDAKYGMDIKSKYFK